MLYIIVTKNMLYGPCGDWCIVRGKCSQKFSKNFRNEITMDDKGYSFHRRRGQGTTLSRNNRIFDNRHVVPYNPVLLEKFNCHINAEVVSSVKAVKYIYKYAYKGHDKAGVTINGNVSEATLASKNIEDQTSRDPGTATLNHDEVRNFVDARYVGPVEAAWRILSKPLQDKSHSITRLPINLPNQQNITISDDCNENELSEALQKQTMLIEYFSLHKSDLNTRQYLYSDIPYHYLSTKQNGSTVSSWQLRKKQFNVIGRMYSVSPAQTELFYLRLSLVNIKGANSFENLRTVNGIVYTTFVAACFAAELIEDDREWKRAMK